LQIKLCHPRLRVVDLELTEVLENQRGSSFADLSRKIYEHGVLFEAALGYPDQDGNYGTYSGPRLAEILLPTVDALISFVMRNGQTPHTIQVLQDLIQRGAPYSAQVGAEALVPGLEAAGAGNPGFEGDEALLTRVAPDAQATVNLFAGWGSETSSKAAEDS